MTDQLSPDEPRLSLAEVKAASRARREGGFPIKDLPALVSLRDSLAAAVEDKLGAPPERFFLGHDNSGHTYVDPTERRAQWAIFTTIPEDDEASWKVLRRDGRSANGARVSAPTPPLSLGRVPIFPKPGQPDGF